MDDFDGLSKQSRPKLGSDNYSGLPLFSYRREQLHARIKVTLDNPTIPDCPLLEERCRLTNCPQWDKRQLHCKFGTWRIVGDPFKKPVNENGRKPISWRLKATIAKRQGDRCARCGKEIYEGEHFHHVISIRRGGEDTEDNLVMLCGLCHSRHDKGVGPGCLPGELKDYPFYIGGRNG